MNRQRVLGALAVAGAVAAILIGTALRPRAPRELSSTSAKPAGALGLYQTAARLGWRVERLYGEPTTDALDPRATYVVIDPPTTREGAGRLLAAVRRGAGLVVRVRAGYALSDSLALRTQEEYGLYSIDVGRAARVLDAERAVAGEGCVPQAREARTGTVFVNAVLTDTGAVRAPGRRIFLDAQRGAAGLPVIAGFPYGRGRVVAVSDGAPLHNEALRPCWSASGIAAIRALEWARPAAATDAPRLVFLELDPTAPVGAGEPSTARAIRRALTEVPAGRMLAQGLLAALVLLLAAAPRALPPRPSRMLERRSPLEHVGALARAYREARATRVAVRRLARGLRRRHGGLAGRGPDDARFLGAVAARHPSLAADAARLTTALARRVPPEELPEVAAAVARIDQTLDAARRGADPLAIRA